MGVNRVFKRGQERIEVRKRWPDGKEYRKFFPNKKKANEVLARIEVSILDGSWKELREELQGKVCKDEARELNLTELAELYLKHCEARNRRPDFKKQALASIRRILGDVLVKDLSVVHADQFMEKRLRDVKPATVNRGLAVIKHMLTFAVERGILEKNPLAGYGLLKEEERALRILTVNEERSLIEAVTVHNPIIGALCAVLGETGLRKSEGLQLKWEDIDWDNRRLTVQKSKSGRTRQVPLTEYALEWLDSLIRYEGDPYVFMLAPGWPLRDPRESFYLGRDDVGLSFVKGFHDLRHYRATQWLARGVDIKTVSHLLGHERIETTMRYLHLIPDHLDRAVRKAEESEKKELKKGNLRVA